MSKITLLLALLASLALVAGACTETPDRGDDDDSAADDDDDDDDGSDDDDSSEAEDDDDSGDGVGDDDDDDDDDDSAADDDDDDSSGGEPGPEIACPGTLFPCDVPVGGSTVGEPDNVSDWSICGADGDHWTGGEDVFVYTPNGMGEVTFSLTWADTAVDLDLFVLDGCALDDATCLASSTSTDSGEEVTVDVSTGVPVYVVVDGRDAAATGYQVFADCTGVEAEVVGTDAVDRTYCLDWDSVNVLQPPGLITLLQTFGGVDVTQFPILLNPTAVDDVAKEILMTTAIAAEGTCNQNLANPTFDLTSTQPGAWFDPYFEVGPSTLTVPAPGLTVTLIDTEMTGVFNADASAIVDGTVDGSIEIPTDLAVVCGLITCYPCSTGIGQCTDFIAESAEWNDNLAGPLIPVP